MTGVLSLMIFSGLLVIVAIDRPFAGSVKVGPDALAIVMADFSAQRDRLRHHDIVPRLLTERNRAGHD